MALLNRYVTAGDLLLAVANEVGLPSSGAPYSTPDNNYVQLRRLLNIVGAELVSLFEWPQLIRDHVYVTTGAETDGIPYPPDFAYMIPQTNWVRTTGREMPGPLTQQEWAYTKGGLVSLSISLLFIESRGKIHTVPSPPPAGQTIAFAYMSRAWVIPADAPTEFADNAQAPSDVIMFEPLLVSRLLKLRFLIAKGFDTSGAAQEWMQAFDAWKSRAKGAPKLNLNGSTSLGYHYLDIHNLPDSGYGG